jgi:hypothetical protein
VNGNDPLDIQMQPLDIRIEAQCSGIDDRRSLGYRRRRRIERIRFLVTPRGT